MGSGGGIGRREGAVLSTCVAEDLAQSRRIKKMFRAAFLLLSVAACEAAYMGPSRPAAPLSTRRVVSPPAMPLWDFGTANFDPNLTVPGARKV